MVLAQASGGPPLRLRPTSASKETGAAGGHSQQQRGRGARRLAVRRMPRVIAALLCLAVCVAAVCVAGCSKRPQPAEGPAAGAASLPPLPQYARSRMWRHTPERLEWAERLRSVYAALPPETQQKLLKEGECSFSLADLPEAEAEVVKSWLTEDGWTRSWVKRMQESAPDVSDLTFKFAGSAEDGLVYFVAQAAASDSPRVEVAAWPDTEESTE